MINPKGITNIIFDMDGTLVDSDVVYEKGWEYAFKKNNIKVSDRTIKSWRGLSVKDSTQAIEKIVGDYKYALEIRETREKYFFEKLDAGKVKLMPHVIELLEFLKTNGIVMSLATSTYEKKGLEILSKLQIDNYFSNMIFGDQVEKSKPSPEIYQNSQRLIAEEACKILVVEDSLTGVNAALAAGLNVMMIPYEKGRYNDKQKEEVIVKSSLLDLKTWLKKDESF